MEQESNQKNPKVQATSVIWGCAVGMLGICVPYKGQSSMGKGKR